MCQAKDDIIQKLQVAVEDAARDVSPPCNTEDTSFRMLFVPLDCLLSKDLIHTSQNSVMTCDSSAKVTLSVTRDLDTLTNLSRHLIPNLFSFFFQFCTFSC